MKSLKRVYSRIKNGCTAKQPRIQEGAAGPGPLPCWQRPRTLLCAPPPTPSLASSAPAPDSREQGPELAPLPVPEITAELPGVGPGEGRAAERR